MESVSFWRLPDSQQTWPHDPFRWNPSAVPEPHPAKEDHGGPREEQGNYRGSVRWVRATARAALLCPLSQGSAEAEGLVDGVHLIATGCNGRESSSERKVSSPHCQECIQSPITYPGLHHASPFKCTEKQGLSGRPTKPWENGHFVVKLSSHMWPPWRRPICQVPPLHPAPSAPKRFLMDWFFLLLSVPGTLISRFSLETSFTSSSARLSSPRYEALRQKVCRRKQLFLKEFDTPRLHEF